jgi:hypothetical protein
MTTQNRSLRLKTGGSIGHDNKNGKRPLDRLSVIRSRSHEWSDTVSPSRSRMLVRLDLDLRHGRGSERKTIDLRFANRHRRRQFDPSWLRFWEISESADRNLRRIKRREPVGDSQRVAGVVEWGPPTEWSLFCGCVCSESCGAERFGPVYSSCRVENAFRNLSGVHGLIATTRLPVNCGQPDPVPMWTVRITKT